MRSTTSSRLLACQRINFPDWFNRPDPVIGANWPEPKRPPLLANVIGCFGRVKVNGTITARFEESFTPRFVPELETLVRIAQAAVSSQRLLDPAIPPIQPGRESAA